MSTEAIAADSDLLKSYAQERSADAFAQLVKRHAGWVYGVGLRVTRSREDAQDVTQECFLQLAAQAGRITQPLPAWLHTLVRGRAIDALRRRGTRQRHEYQSARPEAVPLSLDDWNGLCKQVDEAIAALPDELRVPLIGQYLQGRTQEQLASSLQVSQGTISRRIERAIEQLREQLRRAGVDLSGAPLGVALGGLISEGAPAELVAKLTKIGLSGAGATATASGASVARVLVATAAVMTIAAGAIWWTHSQLQTQPSNAGGTIMAAPSAAFAPSPADSVRRANGRVWIEGLQPGQRDTNPYSQGLAILFQHLGRRDADYVRAMGYSGIAFAMQMDLSGPIRDGKYDVAWWPNDCYAFGMRIAFLGQAFGRELRRLNSDPAAYRDSPQKEYQNRFEPAVIEAVDQGLPVLGIQDAAVLVTGYDSTSHTPILLWPSPGQPAFGPSDNGIPWGIFVPGKPLTPLPQEQAELESLRWAIALWDEKAASTAKDWDASKILTGSKAYSTWLELLQQQKDGVGLGRDSWDNNMMIHLRYNRSAAVAYLRDVASRRMGTPANHLTAAANLYQQALDEANRAPFWGDFNNNPDIRPQKLQEYTDIVRRISQYEAQAIDEIRQVVTLPSDAAPR